MMSYKVILLGTVLSRERNEIEGNRMEGSRVEWIPIRLRNKFHSCKITIPVSGSKFKKQVTAPKTYIECEILSYNCETPEGTIPFRYLSEKKLKQGN